ncbi:MAG: SPFH domain-containing protein [Candidatus Paceibacterota bacterium]
MNGFLNNLGIFLALILLFPVVIRFLAYNNFVFTIVEEGTAKMILCFGGFHRLVMNYKNHYFNQQWDIVEEKSQERKGGLAELVEAILPFLMLKNVKVVGIPFIHSVHWYKFKWTSYEQEGSGQGIKSVAQTKERIIDYILVMDDFYFVRIDEAETEEKIQVNVNILMGLRIVNPYKSLKKVQKWLEATTDLIKPSFRSFINTMQLDEFLRIGPKKEEGGQIIGKKTGETFLELYKVDDQILEQYGVCLIPDTVEVISIDFAKKEDEDRISAEWKAEKDGKARERLARARETEIAEEGKGNAEALRKVVEEAKSLGVDPNLVLGFLALQKAGEKGNTIVVPSSAQGLMLNIPEKKG